MAFHHTGNAKKLFLPLQKNLGKNKADAKKFKKRSSA